ncbi:natural killer cell receptor 2B4 isoform X1 [Lemur catta]|uniref:natural killer cell receptor 2B4 isoform X1 n=1 Tax=Lemur catta TaxID=9447 RepID=UPI001E26E368|nr:natural killer cell receptor 2B4 isoform X1 [Lemur catta]
MLGQAVTLALLLLLKVSQAQECPGSTNHAFGLSGVSLQLWPNTPQTKMDSVEWKVKLTSHSAYQNILKWENGSNLKYESWTLNNISNKYSFIIETLTLLINAAEQKDSGLYCLEVTNKSGKVWRAKFKVHVFDEVEKPLLWGQGKVLDRGKCQVSLSCLVSRDSNVSYAWYRGSELINMTRNLTILEKTGADGTYIYTCNVSNPVSWKIQTLNLTQGCQNAPEFRFWTFLVTIVILITLLLGTLASFCVWKRKRKQPETSPEEFLTIYEDVKDLQTRRNQEQKPKQNFPGEETTIYSTVQSQSSASTSQETANTLYSLIQPSRKSGSKKRNHSPFFSSTVYEEVGKRRPKAQDPAQLSRKELESFSVYS